MHHYKMRDEQGKTLIEQGGIWLLELKKFAATQIESEDQRWLKFFTEGEQLNDDALPDWMITQEMKQVMSTLSNFFRKRTTLFPVPSSPGIPARTKYNPA